MEGGCACGAVRYALTAAPLFVHCCHCKDCQRQTGSAFVLNALIETDRIEMLSGEPVPVSMPTDSGRPHDIYRCPKCLTAVWSDYGRRPVLRFVRVGTLDDPKALPPDVHIFTRSKQPGSGCRTMFPRSKSTTTWRSCGRRRAWRDAGPSSVRIRRTTALGLLP